MFTNWHQKIFSRLSFFLRKFLLSSKYFFALRKSKRLGKMLDDLLRSENASVRQIAALKLGHKKFNGCEPAVLGLLECVAGIDEFKWQEIKEKYNDRNEIEQELINLISVQAYETNDLVRKQALRSLGVISSNEFQFHTAKILGIFIKNDFTIVEICQFLENREMADNFILTVLKDYILWAVEKNHSKRLISVTSAILALQQLASSNKPKSIQLLEEVVDYFNNITTRIGINRLKQPGKNVIISYNKSTNKYKLFHPTELHKWFAFCLRGIVNNIDESEYSDYVKKLKIYLVPKRDRKYYYHESPIIRKAIVELIGQIGTKNEVRYLCHFTNIHHEEDDDVIKAALKATEILKTHPNTRISSREVTIKPFSQESTVKTKIDNQTENIIRRMMRRLVSWINKK